MAKKSVSLSNLFVGVAVVAMLVVGTYILAPQKNAEAPVVLGNTTAATTPSPTQAANSQAAAVASAAMSYCTQNGGFVTTERRGKIGFFQVCNFADDLNCELYALYRGDCPVGGVHTIGYSTRSQVYCALVGGKPNGTNNGNCALPNGTTCTTTQVYQDTCPTD